MPTPLMTFKSLFRLKNIKKIYEDSISKKATRGIDRIGVKVFNKQKNQQFKIIFDKCNKGTFNFSPYVQKLQIKSKNSEPREISISTIKDRIVLFLLKDLLHSLVSGTKIE